MKLGIRNLLHLSAGLLALLVSGVTESQDQTPAAPASPHFTIRIPLRIQNMDEAFAQGWISCRLWRETPSYVELVRYPNPGAIRTIDNQTVVNFDNVTGNGPPEAVVTITLPEGVDPRDAQKFDCRLWLRGRRIDTAPEKINEPTQKLSDVTYRLDSNNRIVGRDIRSVQVADPSKPFRVWVRGDIP